VRVVAATINPTDIQMRSGQQAGMMKDLQPPFVAGKEFAGYVDGLGAGAPDGLLGKSVMGVVDTRRPEGGAHADFVCVPAASVIEVDAGTNLVLAATVPMNGLTALRALELLDLAAGSTLLVTGGAGALGGYVIQLAHAHGIRVIADAKPEDVELLKRLGADTIVPRGDGMEAAVRREQPLGVDGVLDGALLQQRAGMLVRDGGAAVSVRRTHLIDDPRLRVSSVSVTEVMTNTALLLQLREHLRAGQLTPRLAAQFAPAQAAEAYRHAAREGLRGRVVLVFDKG
jgi:NADPH:quinone reductase-like Zn-dependent oxidoreductase